jgi:hypothetical protein
VRAPRDEAANTGSLAALLAERQLVSPRMRAVRHTLDRRDRTSDLQTIGDIVKAGQLLVYGRMQEGRKLGHDNALLSFVGEPEGRARLVGFAQVFARRRGVAPGDIIYDYDAAPLLHNFISRSRVPTFYDFFDLPGLEDLVGRLVVQWPRPHAVNVRKALDPGLVVIEPVFSLPEGPQILITARPADDFRMTGGKA